LDVVGWEFLGEEGLESTLEMEFEPWRFELSAMAWCWIRGAMTGRRDEKHRRRLGNPEVEERRRGLSIKKSRSNVQLLKILGGDGERETLAEGEAV